MLDEVHLLLAVLVPEIDMQYVVLMVDFIAVHLFARDLVHHYQLNARRRRYWSSVFVTEATHTRALWVLDHHQLILPGTVGAVYFSGRG
jgi:hypothetical protein